MEEVIRTCLGIILWMIVTCRLATAQLLLEELQQLKIEPMNMNGTEPYTELTIDQIISRASGGIEMAQNLMLTDDGTVLAELDMRLTHEQFYNLYENPVNYNDTLPRRKRSKTGRKLERSKRKAIRDVILRWPEGVVPYRFITEHFTEKEEYMIRTAMTEWEKYTCLRFRPAIKSDRNVVRFQNGMGCNSQLGMVGGEQPLNLEKNGCRFKGLYLHEIGHAIGLVHEHQLPNRDQYIEILYQNVQPSMRIWFNKYSAQEVDQLKVDYEYSSVMHYGITAFSSDGKSQTIKALHPDKESSIGRVYRKELSFTDVKIVNLMYQCAKQCDSSIVCNNGGYVDQNCKCICPDGSDSCSKAKQDDKDGECFNAHESWQCAVWANQGECQRNPRFMLESCKKACRLCGNEKPDNATCKDNYESSKCDVWKEHGECIVNSEWMHKHCKKTCNACANSGPDPDVNCSNKHPKAEECEKWAAEGECQINRVWMPENCRKSCHMCGKSVVVITTTPEPDYNGECENIHNTLECDKWARTDECSLNPDWMIPNCRKSCKKCEGNDGGGGAQECKNTWDDVQCTGWARDQECMKNSVWMHRNCHKACTKCTPDGSTTDRQNEQTTTQPRITTPGACKNDHRSDKECDTWAKYGHCDLNEWMKVHCAAACGSCKSQEKTTTTSKPDKTDNGGNTGGCADQEKHCAAWARHGFCEDNPNTALRICKKSCNACTVETNECKDKHQLCGVWARGGQCQRNSGYMLRSCQKSCTVC